ncbi:hypothetical protein D047_2730A, partial [Vibrio parahaemolyticus VPTS-2010_2]|jgi:hypothetical protein
MALAL